MESVVEQADGLSLLSVTEVAGLLGVSEEAVRAAVRDGRLPAYRIGPGPKARIRIESSSLAGYLRDAHDARVERR